MQTSQPPQEEGVPLAHKYCTTSGSGKQAPEKEEPLFFFYSGAKIRGEEEEYQKSRTALNIYTLHAVAPSKALLEAHKSQVDGEIPHRWYKK